MPSKVFLSSRDPMNDKTEIYQLFYSVRILKRFKWDIFKTIFSKQNETMLELIVIIDDSENNSNNSNNGDNSKNKKNDDGNKVIMIIINSLLQRGKFLLDLPLSGNVHSFVANRY